MGAQITNNLLKIKANDKIDYIYKQQKLSLLYFECSIGALHVYIGINY